MTKRWILPAILSLLFLPSVGWGAEVWNSSFEASPANGDSLAAGAGKIRDTRNETGDRASVEHFWGTNDDTDDDNGLHRLGSARCFFGNAAPTTLRDSSADHANDGSAGETDLDNSAFNSDGLYDDDVGHGRCWIDEDGADGITNDDCTGAGTDDNTGSPASGGTNTCCTAADTGTCDLDDNKMYVYVGVAGDAGTAPTGFDAGWQEVTSQHDTAADFVAAGAAGVRVKAGANNILFNGDFEYNGCTGTALPTGWSSIDAETISYANSEGLQGDGCQVVVTDVDGGDGISQTLSNLKGTTTYRVTAQVLETGADECTLSTSGASTEVTGMVSVDNTAFAQLEGFFITSAALDEVTISLTNTAAGDICTWDHIAVYRQESAEVPESGIVAVFDTLTTQNIDEVDTCVGSGDPIDCCTAAGVGATCDIDVALQDVPELSITFVPPTEGWIIEVKANISVGCDAAIETCDIDDEEGVICVIEKGGSAVSGPAASWAASDAGTKGVTFNTNVETEFIDINPAAGTPIIYNVACQENGLGANGLAYNRTFDEATPARNAISSLSMIAYPPH